MRIGNLNWCRYGHSKNEAREIDCACYREVDTMPVASAKIPEFEGSISLYNFYGNYPTISHMLSTVDEFLFLFLA